MKKCRTSPKPLLYIDQGREKSICKKRKKHNESFVPFVKCGKVFNPVLPLQLSKKDPPVVLTSLTIDTEKIDKPCILVNFSCFVTSVLKGKRFNNLVFRLVRTCTYHSTKEVLEVWPFQREFVNDTNIKEPVVFNYCECLTTDKRCCTYTIELVKVNLSEQSFYNITQKSMTAQVYCGSDK